MSTTLLQPPYSPVEVDGLTLAFPASVSHLMPELSVLAELRNQYGPWQQFQSDWFFHGFESFSIDPKPGIDTKVALRHLKAIQGSFEPNHEDKEAAVAFLAEQWFAGVVYTRTDGIERRIGSYAEVQA